MLQDDLMQAVLEETQLEDGEYRQETVTGAFGKLEVARTVFRSCCFAGSDLSDTSFVDVVFEDCDFSQCHWVNGYFRGCTFLRCRGDGINFNGAFFKQTALRESTFIYANFGQAHWESAAIAHCTLDHAALNEMVCKKLTWEQVSLRDVDFFRTKLKGMDLSSCTLEGITVSDRFTELRGVKLDPLQAVEIASLLGVRFV